MMRRRLVQLSVMRTQLFPLIRFRFYCNRGFLNDTNILENTVVIYSRMIYILENMSNNFKYINALIILIFSFM